MYIVQKVTLDDGGELLSTVWTPHTSKRSAKKDYDAATGYEEVSLLKTRAGVSFSITATEDLGGSYLCLEGGVECDESAVAEVLMSKGGDGDYEDEE